MWKMAGYNKNMFHYQLQPYKIKQLNKIGIFVLVLF